MIGLQAEGRDVLPQVRERVLKASEQLQVLADLPRVEPGKEQDPSERQALSVLAAWAYPEFLAKADAKKNKGGEHRQHSYSLSNGHSVGVDKKDPLSKEDMLAVASVTGEKIFWAMRTNSELLNLYGIDVDNPTQHQFLSKSAELLPDDSSAEETGLSLVAVRRYLVGKDLSDKVTTEDEFVDTVVQNPTKFPTRDISKMLWDLAREEEPKQDMIWRLAEEVVAERIDEFEPQQLADVACALAVSDVGSEATLEAIAKAATPKLDDLPLDSEDGCLSSLLWAYTHLGITNDELFEGLAQRAVTALVEFEPKVLSNVREICFWSFHRASANSWSDRGRSGRLRHGFANHQFFETLIPLAIAQLDKVHPINCVYFMWSVSKSGMDNQELFDAVAARVGPVASTLDRCGLTMFCWNYAYIGTQNDEVFEQVAEDTLRPDRMAEMAPRDVSGIAWAFAKAGVDNEPLFQGLVAHASGLLRDGLEQRCWRRPNKSLARDIYIGDNSAVDGAVDAFDTVSLSDLLWACAEKQFLEPEFVALCKEYLIKALTQPTHQATRFVRYPHTLSRTLISLAQLTADDHTDLFQAAAPHVVRLIGEHGVRDVIFLIAAHAIAGARDPWVLASLDARLEALFQEGRIANLTTEDMRRLKWALEELSLGSAELRGELHYSVS